LPTRWWQGRFWDVDVMEKLKATWEMTDRDQFNIPDEVREEIIERTLRSIFEEEHLYDEDYLNYLLNPYK